MKRAGRKLPGRIKAHLGSPERAKAFPDFLIIGAQKAGTTWLHRNLQNHPQIWMPKEKELHYFDEKIRINASIKDKLFGEQPADERWRRQIKRQLRGYKKGPSLRDVRWDLRYFLLRPGDEWYASLFDQGRGKITGEATPDYSILGRKAVAHVYGIMPETKIIFMVRNPIERAWSQALMDFSRARSLETVPDEEFYRHFEGHRPRLFSDYLRTIGNWGGFYPEEQIFVGFLEDVHFYPNRLLRRLYRFLGAGVSDDYRVIKRKIHSRAVEQMPTRLAVHLARVYHDDLRRLNQRLGGYASFWLYCAQRLIEAPPAGETIPYPLWESPLWEEWARASGMEPAMGSREAELESGPLSSVGATDTGA